MYTFDRINFILKDRPINKVFLNSYLTRKKKGFIKITRCDINFDSSLSLSFTYLKCICKINFSYHNLVWIHWLICNYFAVSSLFYIFLKPNATNPYHQNFGIRSNIFIKNSTWMLKKKTIGTKENFCYWILEYFISSRTIFNDRVAMINQHNHEAALGLYTFTLKINQFADMV